jgi:hypothetical protein
LTPRTSPASDYVAGKGDDPLQRADPWSSQPILGSRAATFIDTLTSTASPTVAMTGYRQATVEEVSALLEAALASDAIDALQDGVAAAK